MDNKITQIFTIGYVSKNELVNVNDFFESLNFYGIKSLIDIRSNPMPTDYPEFDRGHLHQFCENKDIIYHWAGRQLGDQVKGNEQSQHDGLLNQASRAYADYMGTRNFQVAATQIINMAQQGCLALFSKMESPEKDFRLLLSDYLLLQGIQVTHILSPEESRDHLLHKNARRESCELIYDR